MAKSLETGPRAPEQSPEVVFNPEKEITAEDLDVMMKNLDECRKNADWYRLLSAATEIKIISPGKDVELDKTALQEIRRNIEKTGNEYAKDEKAMLLRILRPNEKVDLDIEAMNAQLEEFKRRGRLGLEPGAEFAHGYSLLSWESVVKQAMRMKILNPEREINLNDDDWKNIEAYLEAIKQRAVEQNPEQAKQHSWWNSFAADAAAIKVVRPDLLSLDATAWQGMREALEAERQISAKPEYKGHNVGYLASAMTILSAEKIEITDKGLEIKQPEKE
jgi:hypothetical protein